jgi:hypothetical protein
LDERAVVAAVWIPHAVQAGKACRGADFVDRGVVLEPWVARGDRAGILGQRLREARVDQAGVTGAAAVVDQAGNRGHAGSAQRSQAFVGPAPVGLVDAVRGGAFPQDRIADCLDAERGEALDVAGAFCMAVAVQLAKVFFAHAVDRAFEATPQFEGGSWAVRALVHVVP